MASVHDVAAYVLGRHGEMTTWKLQKLVYYCQAWSLVWDEKPLYEARIEAWANGPVVRALYNEHRGQYRVAHWSHGDGDRLTADEKETVDKVLEFYGPKSSYWLSELSHREKPWQCAREGLAPGERGQREISLASMQEYYEAIGAQQ